MQLRVHVLLAAAIVGARKATSFSKAAANSTHCTGHEADGMHSLSRRREQFSLPAMRDPQLRGVVPRRMAIPTRPDSISLVRSQSEADLAPLWRGGRLALRRPVLCEMTR